MEGELCAVLHKKEKFCCRESSAKLCGKGAMRYADVSPNIVPFRDKEPEACSSPFASLLPPLIQKPELSFHSFSPFFSLTCQKTKKGLRRPFQSLFQSFQVLFLHLRRFPLRYPAVLLSRMRETARFPLLLFFRSLFRLFSHILLF